MRDEAVVGLCVAASGADAVPARPWPLDAAFQRLAAGLDAGSAYAPAAAEHQPSAERRGTGGAERLLRGLAAAGLVGQGGTGAAAAWMFDADWTGGWSQLLDGLGPQDRAAFEDAGQVLASCVSTWRSALSRASA